ncbi:flagellar hook capping FlgD N-terminal domain-containing protein [Roseivivax sp. CAU 1761]
MDPTPLAPASSPTRTPATPGAPPAVAAAADPAARGTSLAGDFETFLKMLTVQARNQDPLNPLDSSEYAAQLAAFSTVEQQVQTNDLLREIGAALSGGPARQLQDLRNWIGAEVLAPVAAAYDGTPLRLHTVPEAGAETALLRVETADGAVLDRVAIDPAGGAAVWDGPPGPEGAPGPYRFVVESWQGETLIGEAPAQVYVPVTEARRGPDGIAILRTAGGEEIAETAVAGLRVGG